MAFDRQDPAFVNFVDGEGIVHTDFVEIQTRLLSMLRDMGFMGGGMIGRAMGTGSTGLDYDTAQGGAIGVEFNGASGGGDTLNLESSKAYVPHPLISPLAINTVGSSIFVSNGSLVQRRNGSMTGTEPPSSPNALLYGFTDDEYDIQAGIAANTAPVAGDPRWDLVGIRLGWDTKGAASRDFKDAVTGALTSTTSDKENGLTASFEYIVGTQAAFFTPPVGSLTAGFVPLLCIQRDAASGITWDETKLFNMTYPMRLGIEDIYGEDMFITNSSFAPENQGTGAVDWSGADAAGSLFAIPRNITDGCRIIGVGVSAQVGSSKNVDVGLITTNVAPATFTSLAKLDDEGAAGKIDLTLGSGIQISSSEGLDWADTTGASFFPTPFPVWGNGRTYGPMHTPLTGPFSTPKVWEKFAVRIQERSGNNWTATDRVNMVRVYYLY